MISLRLLSVPMLALVAVLAGCSAETATSSGPGNASSTTTGVAAAGDTTTTPAAGNADNHRHGPGSPDMLIGAALRAPINLTDAQRTTITGLEADLHAQRPAFDQAHASALAAAIRSGNVASVSQPAPDPAKIQAHLAASAKAIQTLHDTLTADQRTQLVTSIQSHAGRDHKGPPAFAAHDGENALTASADAPHHGGGAFMDALNLTDAQKAQLAAMHPAKPTDEQQAQMKSSFEAMRTAMNAKLETFKADTFDATTFVTPSTTFQALPGGDMHQKHLANLVSVLTPAQRETLAAKIEAAPTK